MAFPESTDISLDEPNPCNTSTPLEQSPITNHPFTPSSKTLELLERYESQSQGYHPSKEKPPGIFDINFTRFISNTWNSILWVFFIYAHFLGALGAMFYAFNEGNPVVFIIALFVTPISLLFCRIALESEVIFFRIESNTRETKEYLREIKEQLGKK